MIGIVGHLLILVALVSTTLSGVAYFKAAGTPPDEAWWKRIGRQAWLVSLGTSTVAFGLLVYLFGTHQYQYAYVYSNSSNDLPTYFTLAATWAGQEGSFLLWIVYTAILGALIIRWGSRERTGKDGELRRTFEAPVLAVFALCQFFMLTMVAGIDFGAFSVGVSPFQTLAAKFPDAPVLQQPGFVPPDGNGLNDLLQNYWMTIHPPTLFTGFAAMTVPFAFAVAALWKRKYTEWVRPALPWTLYANLVLGVGIIMGGYWAYETLSFGGYWAWDPVENSSLVPWLFGIAAIHSMIVQKKSAAGHKSALILSIAAFMFVVYSTFLTRSGILGDVSVHSFVDLGLYNQLLLWILSMGVVGFGLFAYRYRELPVPRTPPATLSRESMIFTGALTLCLMGLVIIVGTSAPILGRIFRDNPAGVAIEFYNTWTLPLAIVVATLAGLGQLFWWKKMTVENVNRALLKPLALTVVSVAAVLVLTPFVPLTTGAAPTVAAAPSPVIEASLGGGIEAFWSQYGQGLLILLLLFAAFFAFYGNAAVLWRIARGNLRLAGGSITHVGFALMLLGIVSSTIFNDPITDGQGADIRGDRDNVILQLGEPRQFEGYTLSYDGKHFNDRGRTVYNIDFTTPNGKEFRAETEVYQSKTEQWIQHPHVENFVDEDIYIAVYPSAMMDGGGQQSGAPGELFLQRGQSAPLDDGAYTVEFVSYDLEPEVEGVETDSLDLTVGAELRVTQTATGETRTVVPVYLIMNDRTQQFVQHRIPEWDLTFSFTGMQVENDSVRLVVEGAETGPEDWIVVQAYRKPFISLLWLGTIVLAIGFTLSIVRRAQEQRNR
jgi:cytochrome c-type biogenesis protein CcmF